MNTKQLVAATVLLGLISTTGAAEHSEAEKQALLEYIKALDHKPNPENGKKLYRKCAVCHTPEGWGTESGFYPQIAGQLRTVIIKQLADIRAGNRDNPTMYPFTTDIAFGGADEIADVAEYIATLPMTDRNGKGPGTDLDRGKQLYEEHCTECHGDHGEGHLEDHIPTIAGQHFRYLVRQFEWIRHGRRRNADKKMVQQIKGFSAFDVRAVMDYTSRLPLPQSKVADSQWTNPDLPHYRREGWAPR